jgi:biopolymer transport protein ExbD
MEPNNPAAPPPEAPPPSPPLGPEDEEEQAERHLRKYRRAKRKARDAAGEVKELNITAMMDMMTILLVFLLKSYTASSNNLQQTDALQIPNSTTQNKPQDSITVIVSQTELTVNDKRAAPVINGDVPAAYHENEDGTNMLLPSVFDMLQKEVDKQKYIARYNPAAPFTGRVNVIADRRIPYRTVLAVLYTAGQAELAQYKLMAIKPAE